MKKKRIPAEATLVPSEILEQARKSVESDKLRRAAKCVVCGGECSPNTSEHTTEQLCWVCRRLKISAWHEAEQQLPVQE